MELFAKKPFAPINLTIYVSIGILYTMNFIMFLSFHKLHLMRFATLIYIIKNTFCLLVFYYLERINLKTIKELSVYLYISCILLLIFVHFLGIIGLGAKRWINLGVFYLQPSELMKICLPLYLSYFLSQKPVIHLKTLLQITLLVFLPIILVIIEPDMATGVILIVITVSLVFVGGIKKKHILYSLCGLALALPLIWYKMYDYQKQRILTFIGKGDLKTSSYQIYQSRISIGSGRLFGKGFMRGSQFQYAFLPKPDTDFVFSCICEEWGFLGGVTVISIFFYLALLGLHTSLWKENIYEKYLSCAIGVYLFSSFFFNIAMTMGMIPVVGVPLPLLSRGGSSSMTFLTALGLLANIRRNI